MDNMYEPETQIQELLSGLVKKDMMFSEKEAQEITKDIFAKYSDEADKVAIVVVYGGYSVNATASRAMSQIINPLWRVIVVTPTELYKDVAGVKILQVIDALKGKNLSCSGKELRLTDDTREFNAPDFVRNMFSIPAVFTFDIVI